MSTNEIATFQQSSGNSHALANVEGQRAIQEVQAALVIAKRFPRDEKAALDKILNACTRVGLAEQSAYSFARGGSTITGPSIRLAEAIAGYWGNLEYGFREISRGVDPQGNGFSEVEAYAWDMENNVRKPSRFTVKHWRDTKAGGYALKDERDIYELVANQAQRRVRACLLAVIPGDVVDEAQKQCDVTLNASADISPEAIKKLVDAFATYQVTKEQIEKRIQRRLDSIQPAQIIQLRKIFLSLKDAMSKPEEWFEVVRTEEPAETKIKAAPTKEVQP